MVFPFNIFSAQTSATAALLEASEQEEGGHSMTNIIHKPVMFSEVLTALSLRSGQTVVDATLGLAGHAAGIIEKILPAGRLIGIDKDEEALNMARQNLAPFSENCLFANEDFRNIDKVLDGFDIDRVDAILFDLGVSSYQLENASRGFSIKNEGPLDMRMDRRSFISAYDLLNNLTEEEIASILWRFGQERFSRRIAHSVVNARAKSPISSTKQLAELVAKAVPYKARFNRIHPATRTFQALRIAVNRELDSLGEALSKAAMLLNKKGRICVITFHSLEDKIVKENFRQLAHTGHFKLIFKKVLRPSQEEIKSNPRSRSAKMRVIERLT